MSDELAPTTAERLDAIERRLAVLEESRPTTAPAAPVVPIAPSDAQPAPTAPSAPAEPPPADRGLIARIFGHDDQAPPPAPVEGPAEMAENATHPVARDDDSPAAPAAP